MSEFGQLNYFINLCFWSDGLGRSDMDLKEYIEEHYIPLSTLKQVIEGLKWNHHIARNMIPNKKYLLALSDVLTAITKLQEGK